MRNFFHFNKKTIAVLLIVMSIFSLTACSKSDESGINDSELQFDLTVIDPSSVVENESSTSFVAVAENGTSVRFEGYGFSVTKDGIVMQPNGKLFSLDYVGQIEEIYFESDERFDLDGGVAYANTPNPESMTTLAAAIVFGSATNEPLILLDFNTGFLATGVSRYCPQDVTLKKLNMKVNPDVPQTFYSDLDPSSMVYEWLNGDGYRLDWDSSYQTVTGLSVENYALEKIEGPNVLRSDIIAGIDHSSIVVDGTTTFFSSTMSDGTVVRFEGENIKIDDKGIYITPQSSVVSLDAVGKVYGYFPTAADREQYAGKLAAFHVGYAYTYSSAKTSVERANEVHTYIAYGQIVELLDGQYLLPTAVFEPNFFQFGGYEADEESFYVNSLVACYDPSEKVTRMVDAKLDENFSGAYIEGERYDAARETSADLESGNLDFYLILQPDTEIADMSISNRSIFYVPKEFYEVGALKDAQGNVLDKENALISKGCTLELTVGDSVIDMPLDMVERYYGAETMNDLVPYAYPKALGDLNTLVVPVIWADQTEMANDDTLKLFREGIGRIADEKGTVTDYSVTTDEKFSLSEYYDIASYGKMKITSFMTDWYYSDENFADVWSNSPDEAYSNKIMDWVRATYPDMDWSKYDQDGNGYVDSMVILNAGVKDDDEVMIMSYSGAINHMPTYTGDRAGTPDAPRVNSFTNVGYWWMQNDYNTIIHEFAHGLGLIDYYDVNYSGINAVGSFDMQSGSCGDWNAYSKLAVGWMEPQIVSGLESGQSVEYTIGSSALTSDMLVIPAAGKDYEGPFSEYIMLDLFTDDGVNEYDTEKDGYALKDAAGVRISHVNAEMEKRTLTAESVVNLGESAEYTIGTIHSANNYKGETGKYNIEVIQNGGKNTFTDLSQLDTMLDKDDFFYAGDTFTAEDYSEFLYEGCMDDGSAFGYTVEIVSIGTNANGIPSATIRVMRM